MAGAAGALTGLLYQDSIEPAMNQCISAQDAQYIAAEKDRLAKVWEGRNIFKDMQNLTRGIILGRHAGGDFAAAAAISALHEGKPYMMVRVGDGEGNVLGLCDKRLDSLMEHKWFNVIFKHQNGSGLQLCEAKGFAMSLQRAVCASDLVGVRIFTPYKPFSCGPSIGPIPLDANTNELRGVHGMIRSREQIERLLDEGHFTHAILTHAWIYLSLLDHMSRIIDSATRVIVISGRQELFKPFSNRFVNKAVHFTPIPIEPQHDKRTSSRVHYPDSFNEVIQSLSGDLRSVLVLVGAGIFGKIYCHAARKSGAVALDLGSAFDILAGKRTRPAHRAGLVEQFRLL